MECLTKHVHCHLALDNSLSRTQCYCKAIYTSVTSTKPLCGGGCRCMDGGYLERFYLSRSLPHDDVRLSQVQSDAAAS